MSVLMDIKIENAVQRSIKEYIDSLSDAAINAHHDKEMQRKYKTFLDKWFKEVDSLIKGDEDFNKVFASIDNIGEEGGNNGLDLLTIKYQKIAKLIAENSVLNIFSSSISEFDLNISSLRNRNKYEKWLDWAVKNGKGVYLATHVAKLSHSSSKSSSIDFRCFARNKEVKPGYLTTKVDNRLVLDRVYPNNAISPIAAFYHKDADESFVGDFLRNDGLSFLKCFTSSEDKAMQWSEAFKVYIRDDVKNSHFLSKQVYFPIDGNAYHLLMPLISSSMAHALFLKFKVFFDDDINKIWEQKQKRKFHEKIAVSYPNKASLNVTGSNHSNVSSLNGKRGGRLVLLASVPPKWTGKQGLPLNQDDLFNESLGYKLREIIKGLQRLLLTIKSKKIGMGDPVINLALVSSIHEIANAFFDEVIKINLLSDKKGWTVESSFPLHQQLLLELDRGDDVAKKEKSMKYWREQISKDFSVWLNRQLEHKKLDLSPIQERLWKDVFSNALREFIAIQEAV